MDFGGGKGAAGAVITTISTKYLLDFNNNTIDMSPKQDEDDEGWTAIDHPATTINDDGRDGEGQHEQPQQPSPAAAAGDKHDGDRVVPDLHLDDLKLASSVESRFFEGDKAMFTASPSNASAVKVRVISVSTPNYKIALPSGETMDVPFDHPNLLSLEEYENLQLQQEVGMLDVVSSDMYGGNGGGPFNHDLAASKNRRMITEIVIRSGAIIDGIGASFSDGTTSFYGGDGGGLHRLVLKSGECITEVTVVYGKLVTGLTFTTNTGRTLSRGGPGSILLGGLNSSVVTLKAPGRFYALVGLSGRFGKYLDAIQVHWGPIFAGSDVQKQDNKDIVTKLTTRQHLKTTELFGNEENGVRFDDGHFNIQCTDISVISLCDGPIRGLCARYYTGRQVQHGGKMSKIPNKSESTEMKLSKGEYISEVIVVYNHDAVVGLTFVTNKNQTLGPCGIVPGDNDSSSARVKAPSGYKLIGFRGTCAEKAIHSIGFNWSPVAKGC